MRSADSQERTKGDGAPDILVERGCVALVTFNRPAKRNAISLAMWHSLTDIFASLDADPSVRAVILTGRGSFSAGADISEFPFNRATVEQAEAYEAAVEKALSTIGNLSRPTIAAVHGNCIGGGMALAQGCDFRVSDSTATFGVPAAKLGIVYNLAECQQLTSIVGIPNAKRILLTGERFNAEQAARYGFVTLCPEGQALATAQELAGAMADNAPLSISGMKFILNSIADGTTAADKDEIDERIRHALSSDDYREAVSAFREKRKPMFKNV